MATFRATTAHQLDATTGGNLQISRTITAGDLCVWPLTWEDSQTITGSITDTAGGTWVVQHAGTAPGGAPCPVMGFAYCLNHPGGAATLTATLTGTANPLRESNLLCFQPGAGNTFQFDVAMAPVTGASATSFAGTLISTQPGVVVQWLAGFQLTVGVAAGGTPAFTRDTTTEDAGGRSFAQYLINNSGGNVTPGCSWAAPAGQYVLAAVSFKEVTAGGGGSDPVLGRRIWVMP